MSATTDQPAKAAISGPKDIKLYSHSTIFYWWPVWLVGYTMAFLTYLDGGQMAVVPPGTEARRDWRVEVAPGRLETREGLILPAAAAGQVRPGESAAEPEQPYVRVAHTPYLGTL